MHLSCRLLPAILCTLIFSHADCDQQRKFTPGDTKYSPYEFALNIMGVGALTKPPKTNSSGLRIIVSGLSRTGTQSVKYALNSVGYKCYHSEELMTAGHAGLWLDAVTDGASGDAALQHVADKVTELGFDCVIDLTWPWATRLIKIFPKAKVLHTVRDSPDSWYKSWYQVSNAFLPLHGSRPFRFFVDFEFHKRSCREMGGVAGYGTDNVEYSHPLPWVDIPKLLETKQGWIDAYTRQQQRVEAATMPGQLLVYNVKAGWAPLCSFLELGSACPTSAFPNLNQSQNFELIHSVLIFICYAYPFLALFSLAVVLACGRFTLLLFGRCGKKSKCE